MCLFTEENRFLNDSKYIFIEIETVIGSDGVLKALGLCFVVIDALDPKTATLNCKCVNNPKLNGYAICLLSKINLAPPNHFFFPCHSLPLDSKVLSSLLLKLIHLFRIKYALFSEHTHKICYQNF